MCDLSRSRRGSRRGLLGAGEVLADLLDDGVRPRAVVDRDPLGQLTPRNHGLGPVGRQGRLDHDGVEFEAGDLGGDAPEDRDASVRDAHVPLRVEEQPQTDDREHHERDRDTGPDPDAPTAVGGLSRRNGARQDGHPGRVGRRPRRRSGRGGRRSGWGALHRRWLGGRPVDRRPRGGARPLAVVAEIQDDRGDVVDPAGAVGQDDQALHRLLGIRRIQEGPPDLVLGDHPGHAVGAQQQPVTRLDAHVALVDLHALVHAQRPREDAAMRVRLGLLRRDLAFDDHAVHQRVILGELCELSAPQQVCARVADVRKVHLVAVDECGGEGGAHARDAPIALRAVEDGPVGLRDLIGEGPLVPLEQLLNGLQRKARSHLAAAVAAHAICHGVQRPLDQVGVLVALAHLADVRRGADPDPHRRSSSTVLPTFRTSPAWISTGCCTRWSFRSVPLVDPRSSTYQAPSFGYRRACTWETYVSWRRIAHRSPRPISASSLSLIGVALLPPPSWTTTWVGALPPREGFAVAAGAGVRACWVAARLRPDTSVATDLIARYTKK